MNAVCWTDGWLSSAASDQVRKARGQEGFSAPGDPAHTQLCQQAFWFLLGVRVLTPHLPVPHLKYVRLDPVRKLGLGLVNLPFPKVGCQVAWRQFSRYYGAMGGTPVVSGINGKVGILENLLESVCPRAEKTYLHCLSFCLFSLFPFSFFFFEMVSCNPA